MMFTMQMIVRVSIEVDGRKFYVEEGFGSSAEAEQAFVDASELESGRPLDVRAIGDDRMARALQYASILKRLRSAAGLPESTSAA